MKIALITDTHLGVRNDQPAFYPYFAKSFAWFFKELDDRNIKCAIHLGDLLDRRKYLNYLTLSKLREDFLDPMAQRDIEFRIIPGNHDSYFKNTLLVNSIHELLTLRYPNIHTCLKPTLIEVGGVPIQLIPWICEDNYDESIDAITKSRADILFGHLELKGFQTNSGHVSETGLDRDIFNRYDLVCTGHYHHRSRDSNIIYIGAFTEQSWNDYNDPRGFTIFDTETRELEFFPNPYSIFNMISYDDSKDPAIHLKDYSKYKDTYVKVVVMHKEPRIFDMFLEALSKAGPIDITLIEDANSYAEAEEQSVDQAEDTPTIISKFIDGISVPSNVDKSKFKDYMRNIHTEASTLENAE